ncbi:hypothetical protein GCM10009637_07770 [Brevibacterium luteolum]
MSEVRATETDGHRFGDEWTARRALRICKGTRVCPAEACSHEVFITSMRCIQLTFISREPSTQDLHMRQLTAH